MLANRVAISKKWLKTLKSVHEMVNDGCMKYSSLVIVVRLISNHFKSFQMISNRIQNSAVQVFLQVIKSHDMSHRSSGHMTRFRVI